MKQLLMITGLIFSLATVNFGQKTRTVTVTGEQGTTVWVDDVKRGKIDTEGKLTIKFVASGTRRLRARAYGFKEVSQSLLPTQSVVKLNLVKTTDKGELTFQEAERTATLDREKAIELYKQSIELRPKYAEAYVAMARIMTDSGDTEGALEAIKNARKLRPIYPEASAVEGRILKADGEEAKAIASFKRAIKEGNGFQPEAHTGLGLLYKEKAENAANSGDFEAEEADYKTASSELKLALAQLGGTEPVLYEMLGSIYEKTKRYPEAIATYEEYLRLFPNTPESTTFRSYIVQVKKLMAEQ